jgi:predicted amidophosphoribosyltransferase
VPLFPYDAAGQEILTLWKGTGLRAFSPVLAGALLSVLRASGAACGALVPVPPRPGKIRDKGWDQVEELAALIELERDVPVRRLLERTSSVQQKRLGRSGRRVNLRGHIQVRSDGVALPDTVTLLDDLMTTGSTLDACAAALKAAGCGKVYGLTLFYD